MDRSAVLVLMLLCTVAMQSSAVEIPPAHHPWGRFEPGSWQRLRVTTEVFGSGDGKSVGITEITTRLIKVEKDGVILTREIKDGDQTTTQDKVKYAWDGSQPNDTTDVGYSVDEMDVEGSTYACQTHRLTTKGDGITTITKSWYSPDYAPYFLKRMVRVTGKRRETSSMRVTRFVTQREVLDKKLTCWESETITSSPASAARTTTFSSLDVPGGVVFSESEVRDKQQGVSEHVRIELIAYEANP